MKKSLNALKKEVQSWLNLSQTASPNGKLLQNLIRRFIHVIQWYFLKLAISLQWQLLAIVQLLTLIRYVLLCPYFLFCQQYFWSIITSFSSSLNFTSLAKLNFWQNCFAHHTNFYLLFWSLWNFNKCKSASENCHRFLSDFYFQNTVRLLEFQARLWT